MVKWYTCDRRVVTLYCMWHNFVMPEPIHILRVV
jgi:hypothetical protein